ARKALAGSLDESLLACPEPEERRLLLACGKAPQFRRFPRSEVTTRDVLRLRQRPHLLDVDTQLAASREGQHDEPARVGDVEAQPVVFDQGGLASAAVADPQVERT